MMKEHIPAYVAPLVLYSSRWTWFKQFVWSFNIFVHYHKKNSQDLINFIYLYPGWWHFTNMTLHIFNKHLAEPAAAPILVFWEHLHLKHFMIYLWYILDITEILQPDMDVKKYLNGCEEIFKFSYFWLHITFISK